MKHRILVVEDDSALLRGLVFNLEREGHEVVGTETGGAGLEEIDKGPIDLLVLDLNLPDMDGTDVLRKLRADGHELPVICLTARTTEADVVMGLSLGADDYVRKPFSLAELLARVEARLRRDTTAPGDRLRLGAAEIDWDAHVIRHPTRMEELTPQETDVLRYLADRLDQAVERADVLRDLWGLQGARSTRTLDNHVGRLRRKLEEDPARPRHLITVHGVGYRLQRDIS